MKNSLSLTEFVRVVHFSVLLHPMRRWRISFHSLNVDIVVYQVFWTHILITLIAARIGFARLALLLTVCVWIVATWFPIRLLLDFTLCCVGTTSALWVLR